MDWVAQARALASQAHAGQQDKAGHPYIEHVARVASAIHDDDMAKAAAWLHDVVEDCPQHAAQVQAFPAPIRDTVTLLSRHSAADADQYYARIRQHPLALKVKLADIADNAHPRRLLQLAPAVADRLRGKYAAALVALGGRIGPTAAADPAPSRLLQLMNAAHTLSALANEADVGAHSGQDAPHPRRAELLKVRDIVLAEVEAQMTPETFVIWSDMYVRP
jgi:HD domain